MGIIKVVGSVDGFAQMFGLSDVDLITAWYVACLAKQGEYVLNKYGSNPRLKYYGERRCR